ncbi:zf-TFIIB domain-containing protein [Pseudomonas fluorescens]|uniref:TFIIB-type zinc ribbon-containing protein n=1 Tax=Pseudomonas fluorescens TaxID=294 RepID=UPI0028809D19|nr:zf-TFIIB domain-containing protein [Pseudomonas fluorescens]
MTERQSIEIDYCPQCRGVWLDRGELDKIIERSQQQEAVRFLPQNAIPPAQYAPPAAQPDHSQHGSGQGHGDQQGHHGGGWRDGGHKSSHKSGHQSQGGHQGQQSYRKKSFLQELFD